MKKFLLWLKQYTFVTRKYMQQRLKARREILQAEHQHQQEELGKQYERQFQELKDQVNGIIQKCSIIRLTPNQQTQNVDVRVSYSPKPFQRSRDVEDLQLLANQMGRYVARSIIEHTLRSPNEIHTQDKSLFSVEEDRSRTRNNSL